uniref:PRORP domain-containing protein n=1 Tax=Caenorhabditis tropicalis TaxID=1561998 RepID=A0A1I7T8I6_9PELO
MSLLAEVIRCHSYFDETVFLNTVKILKTTTEGARADGIRLGKMRYIAIVYHAFNDKEKRKVMKDLAEKIEKCKIPMLRKEQDLFYDSMKNTPVILKLEKCIHKNDLVLCYFRRDLEMKNWESIKQLLTLHPNSISLFEHIEAFLEVAKHRNIGSSEVLDVFMKYTSIMNPYFMEYADFNNVFSRVKKYGRFHVSEEHKKPFKRTHISIKNAEILKNRIDEYVRDSKEGFVKTKEYERIERIVSEWKKKNKIENGRDVVVVDALNFGSGKDSKTWKSISDQFRHVFFATRLPPKEIRAKVIERYNGNAVFCDKLSADDLIILRVALEFGPLTSLVTNDRYRDHRKQICRGNSELEKIWDDFLIDATYRHFDGRIESRRGYNLRIRFDEGKWFVPVLDSDGHSPEFRKIKVYCIYSKENVPK